MSEFRIQNGSFVDEPVEGAHGVDGVAAPVVDVAVVDPLEEDVFDIVVGGKFPGDEAGLEVAVDVGEVVGEIAGGGFVLGGVGGRGIEEGGVVSVGAEELAEVVEDDLPVVVGEAEFGRNVGGGIGVVGEAEVADDGGGGVKNGDGVEEFGEPLVAVLRIGFDEGAVVGGGIDEGADGRVVAE